jgi:hypothetical protein
MPKLIRVFTFINITTTVVEILVGFPIRKYWFLKINAVDVYIFISSDFPRFYNSLHRGMRSAISYECCVYLHSTNKYYYHHHHHNHHHVS